MEHHQVFVALDNMGLDRGVELASRLKGRVGYKLNDLWDSRGAEGVKKLREAGASEIWVDVKLKDIPNTVANRVAQISQAAVNYITVMADGEIEMMTAAVKARTEFFRRKQHLDIDGNPLPAIGTGIIAVTVLTSFSEEQTHLTYGQPAKAAALYLARLAKLSGVNQIVCSPQEVGPLSKRPELAGMQFFVPGIRPAGKDAGDQKRFDTPANAIRAGATSLVIGRPITEADDSLAAFEAIAAEIEAAS